MLRSRISPPHAVSIVPTVSMQYMGSTAVPPTWYQDDATMLRSTVTTEPIRLGEHQEVTQECTSLKTQQMLFSTGLSPSSSTSFCAPTPLRRATQAPFQ
jgi:hypothetical protein